jgi:hypothetical protein
LTPDWSAWNVTAFTAVDPRRSPIIKMEKQEQIALQFVLIGLKSPVYKVRTADFCWKSGLSH